MRPVHTVQHRTDEQGRNECGAKGGAGRPFVPLSWKDAQIKLGTLTFNGLIPDRPPKIEFASDWVSPAGLSLAEVFFDLAALPNKPYHINMTNPNNTQSPSNIIATRAVHAAMAASVKADGNVSSQALYTTAAEYNAAHFGGLLTAIMVEITTPGSPRALATHEPKTPEGVDCVIRIAPSVVAAGDKLAFDVLLHEMIHVWQTETDNREPGYAGHGPKFAAECNRIGAALGLAPVGVKGRDGLPDCAQWPLNVRPEGYYGESPRATKAVKAATKARAPKSPRPAVAPVSKVDAALALLVGMTPEELDQVQTALKAWGRA